jgi:hypothetical protein
MFLLSTFKSACVPLAVQGTRRARGRTERDSAGAVHGDGELGP